MHRPLLRFAVPTIVVALVLAAGLARRDDTSAQTPPTAISTSQGPILQQDSDIAETYGPPAPLAPYRPDPAGRSRTLSSQLSELVVRNRQLNVFGQAVRAGAEDLLTPRLRDLVTTGSAQIDASGNVRVEIGVVQGAPVDEVSLAVAGLGATIEGSYKNLVQSNVPISALASLEHDGNIGFVRLPLYAQPDVLGEGVNLTNANAWQTAGMTGSGVKVGVLDIGFTGYAALLGSELPASVTTHNCRADGDFNGGTVHGAAVAEIVHEMAPGAQLYLASFSTTTEMAACVTWLQSQGVKVINMSAGSSVTGPGNGTGPSNDIVASAVASGITWVNAAGNEADGHWRGSWADADADLLLNFSGADETQTITLPAGYSALVLLKWNDPFGGSCNDYDLYVLDSLYNILTGSEGTQACAADPIEGVVFTAPYSGTYHIVITRYSASGSSLFNLYAPTTAATLEYNTASYSLIIPADNPSILTAGAVAWSSPNTIEPFSSQGPTESGLTKPDIVGPDRVSGSSYGPSGFPGTSAASPHVAGAAALVLQANPAYTPAQVKSFLEGRAIGLGAAGKDNVYGSGRLAMGAAPAAPTPTATPTRTNTPTPTNTATNTATPTATFTPGPDADGDGVSDAADNCPSVYNPAQTNTDGNFIDLHVFGKLFDDITAVFSDNQGDACDVEIDNDGVPNDVEAQVGPAGAYHPWCTGATGPTDPLLSDTDDDMVLDGAECALGTDPLDAASKPPAAPPGDTDHDGLTDAFEATIGTNPALVDTDGDRLLDSVDYKGYQSDPLEPDTDGDACTDGREAASVNGDVKVNSLDMVTVASHFGPRTSGKYIKDFDVNKDGNINSIDMLIQAKLFTSLPC